MRSKIFDLLTDIRQKTGYKNLVIKNENAPLLIKDLHKKYGATHAVRGVHLELKKGEVFGLLGPNGAGKTSIISCLVTLEKPTSGSIEIFGHPVSDESEAKAYVGIVPQEIVNHGYFSVQEILEFQSGFYGRARNGDQIKKLLVQLQLDEHKHKKVKQLSGGMKRRLMIAKALVHSPQLLLLDEPTAGVDIELRSHLWDFVRALKGLGTTILLTTHYLEEAEELCDRVAVLNKGQIIALDKTKNLIDQMTARELRLKLKNQSDYVSHRIPMGVEISDWFKQSQISFEQVADFRIEEGSLEDAVLELLKKGREQ